MSQDEPQPRSDSGRNESSESATGRDDQSGPDPEELTIQAAGRIVKYSREIYHLDTVEEVANMTLEATPHFIEGHPTPAVTEIKDGSVRVLASMDPAFTNGEKLETNGGDTASDTVDARGAIAAHAYETATTLVCADSSVSIEYTDEEMRVVEEGVFPISERGGVTIAAPTIYRDGDGDSGAVLVVHWPELATLEQHHVKPVDYLAEHVATAIVNIRSRERLERTRNDLQKRKEMLEVYDRLLRHDLGNDLQVITGFSGAAQSKLEEDHEAREYVDKIFSTAEDAAELIEKVGDTVKTLQKDSQPEPREIEPILSEVVDSVETKHESLSTTYDPPEFEYRAYAGDLIDSVFANILSNAAVHNEDEITVHLYSEQPSSDTVVVGFADDGDGISEEIREDIFEMGKKGSDSEGTGFGLGLARALVESYGGTITVGDSEYGGADFRIQLERV